MTTGAARFRLAPTTSTFGNIFTSRRQPRP